MIGPCIRFAWALGVAFLLTAVFAMPPAKAGPFDKVTAVKFFIVDFEQAGLDCGLDKAALREAFMAPAREQGLQVTDSAPYWIFIRATTLRYSNSACVTNVDASVLVNTRYFNPATLDDRSGRVELWSRGNLLISDITVHAVVVNNAFRELGHDFLGQWRRDR